MTFERSNVGEHAAHWRRTSSTSRRPAAAERTLQAERIAAWSARNREVEGMGTQTRTAVEQSRRHLHIPGATYTVGAERYAADGSRWRSRRLTGIAWVNA